MDRTVYDKVLDRLRTLCSRREYCSGDMLKKAAEYLSRYGCEPDMVPDAAEEVLEALRKDRYVDDLRYASSFARDKSGIAGWGPVKIRYALSAGRPPEPFETYQIRPWPRIWLRRDRKGAEGATVTLSSGCVLRAYRQRPSGRMCRPSLP